MDAFATTLVMRVKERARSNDKRRKGCQTSWGDNTRNTCGTRAQQCAKVVKGTVSAAVPQPLLPGTHRIRYSNHVKELCRDPDGRTRAPHLRSLPRPPAPATAVAWLLCKRTPFPPKTRRPLHVLDPLRKERFARTSRVVPHHFGGQLITVAGLHPCPSAPASLKPTGG